MNSSSKAALSRLIDAHVARYRNVDLPNINRAQAAWMGDFGADYLRRNPGEAGRRRARLLTTVNVIYAVIDSARSNLSGPVSATFNGRFSPLDGDEQAGLDALINWTFDISRLDERINTAILHSQICKQAWFVTELDMELGLPVTTTARPGSVHFDPTATYFDESAYFLYLTPIPEGLFWERVRSGYYRMTEDQMRAFSSDIYWPDWLTDATTWSQNRDLFNSRRWVWIWQFWDCHTGDVVHYHQRGLGGGVVLRSGGFDELPLTRLAFDETGRDMFGHSDVHLLLDKQDSINDLTTLQQEIAYRLVPKMLYDSSRVKLETLLKAARAPVGAFVPANVEGGHVGAAKDWNLANAFMPLPLPDEAPAITGFINFMRESCSFETSLMDSKRGQSTGARTATELAVMQADARDRISSRRRPIDNAVAELAAKHHRMIRSSPRPRLPRDAFLQDMRLGYASKALFAKAPARYKIDVYPRQQVNPQVVMERMIALTPLLQGTPRFDADSMVDWILRMMGAPANVLLTKKEFEEKLKAQADAMAAAQGGAAGAGMAAGLEAGAQGEAAPPPGLDLGAAAAPGNVAAGAPPSVGAVPPGPGPIGEPKVPVTQ